MEGVSTVKLSDLELLVSAMRECATTDDPDVTFWAPDRGFTTYSICESAAEELLEHMVVKDGIAEKGDYSLPMFEVDV
jgi:hypothetical protein